LFVAETQLSKDGVVVLTLIGGLGELHDRVKVWPIPAQQGAIGDFPFSEEVIAAALLGLAVLGMVVTGREHRS
jgi:hypothetical protein